MSTDFWEEREIEKYKLMKELNSKPVKKNQQKLHSLVGSLNQTLNCDAGKTTTTSTIITNLCRVVDDVYYEAVGRDAGHRC